MGISDKKLVLLLKQKTVVSCNEEKIDETISTAKKAYCIAESEHFLSRMEFLYIQSKYIRKHWWIFQGLLLLGAWMLLKYSESGYYIRRSIGVAAPLFVLLIIPEIWKNKSINAMEIEGAAYYSLRQIYAARFVLFALVDITLLSIFFAAASRTGKIAAGELIVQFLVPFNITCCICFRMLYSKKVMSEAFAMLLCIIWTAIWVQLVLQDAVYNFISASARIAILIFSVLYLIYVIWKGQTRYREQWEVKTSWD